MGLLGVLLGLALLVSLAFRGWSVLLLAPVAALLAAAFAGEPLLAHWTQTFMGSAAQFLAQFFPLFLLGALFGKLMEDSGSVTAIAGWMTARLGAGRAMLAVVLAGALVTYGGVSLFVAFFVLAPMAEALFRVAAIPRRLMPAAIALGTSTFTMSALPGTPAIQNAIPMPFFGTTPFAAPGLGVIAAAIMLGFGLWWLGRAEAAARRRGEGFGSASSVSVDAAADDPMVRERTTTAHAFDPAEIHHAAQAEVPPTIVLAALPLAVVVAVNLLMSFIILPRMDTAFLAEPRWGATSLSARGRGLVGGRRTCRRHHHAPPRHGMAPARPAGEPGRRRQCRRAAGLQCGEPGGLRRCRRGAAGVRPGARLGARYRRRPIGVARHRHKRAVRADGLGIGRTDYRAGRAGPDLHASRRRSRASIRRYYIGWRSSALARWTACPTTAP